MAQQCGSPTTPLCSPPRVSVVLYMFCVYASLSCAALLSSMCCPNEEKNIVATEVLVARGKAKGPEISLKSTEFPSTFFSGI